MKNYKVLIFKKKLKQLKSISKSKSADGLFTKDDIITENFWRKNIKPHSPITGLKFEEVLNDFRLTETTFNWFEYIGDDCCIDNNLEPLYLDDAYKDYKPVGPYSHLKLYVQMQKKNV